MADTGSQTPEAPARAMDTRTRVCVVLANGFGLGLSPFASGTVGSIPGVLLVLAMGWAGLSWPVQAAVTAALTLVAIPIAGVAEKHYGRKDDGRIVIDEYLTYPICMLGLPWMAHPSLLAIGFVVNRIMDIVKIPPARQSQKLGGGLGIVADDAIACLYALALNHAIHHVILRRFL